MILIEIESYKGNTFLYGKTVTVTEFNKQIREIEKTYDKQNDNFIEQLCKIYRWEIIQEYNEIPDITYDRDTKRIFTKNSD